MAKSDDYRGGLSNPHEARPVTDDGRLSWVGPLLPHQKGEFFLDGVNLGNITLARAMEFYNHLKQHEETRWTPKK
jgi:hypothetical protein